MTRIQSFRAGVRDSTPLWFGIGPFGMITGMSAVASGLEIHEAVGMSLLVFAGASQLAATALMAQGAGVVTILLTTLLVNLRLAVYSAALAPWLRTVTVTMRSLMAYVMTDHAFALAMARFRADSVVSKRDYFLGAALSLWIVWQFATVAGAVVGVRFPASWNLEFSIPLSFIAILAPDLRNKYRLVAASTAGTLVLLLSSMPNNTEIVLASLVGIGLAATLEGVRSSQSRSSNVSETES